MQAGVNSLLQQPLRTLFSHTSLHLAFHDMLKSLMELILLGGKESDVSPSEQMLSPPSLSGAPCLSTDFSSQVG